MAYPKTSWANGTTPAINAANLNKIEQGIEDANIRSDFNGITINPFFLEKSWLHNDEGHAWGTTGMRTNAGFMNTGYIPCKPGDSISYKLSISSGFSVLAVFNASKTCTYYLEGAGTAEGYAKEGTYTFSSGDAYFMCCATNTTTAEGFNYIEYNVSQGFLKTDRIIDSVNSLKNDILGSSRNLVSVQPVMNGKTKIDLGRNVTFSKGVNFTVEFNNITATGSNRYVAFYDDTDTLVAQLTFNNLRNISSCKMFSEEITHTGRYESNANSTLSTSVTFKYFIIENNRISAGTAKNYMLSAGTMVKPYVPYMAAEDYNLGYSVNPNFLNTSLNALEIKDKKYWGVIENAYRDSKGSLIYTNGSFTTRLFEASIGDTISYTLFGPNNIPLFFIYDDNMNISSIVLGTGTSNKISGSHTFVSGEKYFSFSGTLNHIDEYVLSYNDVPQTIKDYANNPKYYPDYWDSAVESAISSVKAGLLDLESGDSFIFITDQHWKSNAKNSSPIIDYIANKTGIYNVFVGGDIVATNNATNSGAMGEIMDYLGSFRNKDIRLFATLGNHDANSVAQSVTEAILTTEQQYNSLIKPEEKWLDTEGIALCNIYDNKSQKMRYIQFFYTADNSYIEEVADKLRSALISTPSDYTVVLMSHAYWTNGIVPTASTQYANLILGIIDDIDADVPLWIVGHCHTDDTVVLTSTNNKNLRVVSTTTDCYKQNPASPSMTVGTTTEQAFDIYQIDTTNRTINIIRVGAGSDRSYTY